MKKYIENKVTSLLARKKQNLLELLGRLQGFILSLSLNNDFTLCFMRKSRPYLFELVKSLDRSEVLIYKEFATRRKENSKYAKVFDAIRRMKVYDEQALKEEFEGGLALNRFAFTKHYLYNQILASLRLKKRENSIPHLYLDDIRLLREKGLYHHVSSHVCKLLKQAEEMEMFRLIIDLLEIELEVSKIINPHPIAVKELKQLQSRIDHVYEKESNLKTYRDLYNKVFIALRSSSEEQKEVVDEVLSHALMSGSEQCQSSSALIWYHATLFEIAKIKEDTASILFQLEKVAQTLENKPELQKEDTFFLKYLNAIYYLGLYHTEDKNWAKVEEIQNKLVAIVQKHPNREVRIFERNSILGLLQHTKKLEFEAGCDLVDYISAQIDTLGSLIHKDYLYELHHVISIFYLVFDSQYALKWISKNRNEPFSDYRPHLHFMAWLLFLVELYNRKDWDLLKNKTARTQTYFRSKEYFSVPIQTLLRFFKRSSLCRSEEDRLKLLSHLKEEVNENPEFKYLNRLFDFPKWVEAKIQRKKMADFY